MTAPLAEHGTDDQTGAPHSDDHVDGSDPDGRAVGPVHVRGLPQRTAYAGASLLVAAGLFPWFTAGAIASEVLRGRALVMAVAGIVVFVATLFASRAPRAWQAACLTTAIVGAVLVVSAIVRPPVELTASAGTGLAAVGTVLVGGALFAARWRRHLAPSEEPTDGVGEPSAWTTRRRIVTGAVLVAAISFAYLIVWPAGTPSLRASASPTTSYGEAVELFEDVTADETSLNVFEPCRSRLLTHGERTAVSVVLFHGLTNCPEQFVEFGTRLFDDGANVLILRAPEHGIAAVGGSEIGGVANVSDLTARDLRRYADVSVDIATGLGDEVRVLGLSMGGVIAAWTAQERSDVDRVVAVAPALTIPFVPASLTRVFRNVFDKLPNVSLPSAGNKLDHAYAGETTKGLDATFAMAAYVADQGYGTAPAARDVVVVLNPDDDQVDPVHLSSFANAWSTNGGAVTLHRLPAVGLPHDVIDPDQPEADTGLVYPILVELLNGAQP